MRFQPPLTLTVEAVFIVIQYGVEGRWRLIVLSAVDILLCRCRDEVSPSSPRLLLAESVVDTVCTPDVENIGGVDRRGEVCTSW